MLSQFMIYQIYHIRMPNMDTPTQYNNCDLAAVVMSVSNSHQPLHFRGVSKFPVTAQQPLQQQLTAATAAGYSTTAGDPGSGWTPGTAQSHDSSSHWSIHAVSIVATYADTEKKYKLISYIKGSTSNKPVQYPFTAVDCSLSCIRTW